MMYDYKHTNLNIEQIFPMLELNPKQKAWYVVAN